MKNKIEALKKDELKLVKGGIEPITVAIGIILILSALKDKD